MSATVRFALFVVAAALVAVVGTCLAVALAFVSATARR